MLFQRAKARAPKPFPRVSVLNADDEHFPYYAGLHPPGLRTYRLCGAGGRAGHGRGVGRGPHRVHGGHA